MIKLIKIFTLSLILIILAATTGCNNSSTNINSTANELTQKPATPSTSTNASPPSINRVDVVYFYPKIRCGPCLSVEIRTKELIDKYFKDAVVSGKLTFQTYELQQKENAEIVKKYGAISSQLFINTIKNNTENIKHIQEVWLPKYLNDQISFEELLRNLISKSLKEIS